jgi:hypothetical protein
MYRSILNAGPSSYDYSCILNTHGQSQPKEVASRQECAGLPVWSGWLAGSLVHGDSLLPVAGMLERSSQLGRLGAWVLVDEMVKNVVHHISPVNHLNGACPRKHVENSVGRRSLGAQATDHQPHVDCRRTPQAAPQLHATLLAHLSSFGFSHTRTEKVCLPSVRVRVLCTLIRSEQ